MSLFETAELAAPTASETLPETEQVFVDLRDWYLSHPREPIPPNPSVYSKDALCQNPGLEWLHGVEAELIYPTQPDLDWQRQFLKQFVIKLKSECTVIPAEFCDKFPKDYAEPVIALDTETTGLDTRVIYDYDGNLVTRLKLVGLSLATSANKGYYLPVMHTQQDGVPNWDPQVIAEFIDQIHAQFAVIYHNAYYDREVLALNGVTVFREWPYFFDTQVLDYFHDVNQKVHGLKACSVRHLGRKMVEIQELIHGLGSKNKTLIFFDTLCATTGTVYAVADTLNTYGLFVFFAGMPEQNNMFATQAIPLEIDHKMIEVRRHMCRTGIPVNFRYYYYAIKDALMRAAMTEQYIYELIGRKIELGSPKQLSLLLFDELRIPPCDAQGQPAERGAQGNYSTGEDILDILFERYPDQQILKYIVIWRKIASSVAKIFAKALVNSYTDVMLPYTKIQPQFNQTNVPTGRLSSSSSDGAERVTMKLTGKNKNIKHHTYENGSWDAGFNTQGIPSGQWRTRKVKKIKKLPPEAGIDLKSPYPDWVTAQFLKSLAEV